MDFDTIIIGTGQNGALLRGLSEMGRKTAIIERGVIGGTCINYGCTPTKIMASCARVAHLARRAADFGVHHGATHVNLSEVRALQRRIVKEFRKENLQTMLNLPHLEIIKGEARFDSPHSIVVKSEEGERTLSAPNIVIDTGARNVVPPIDGLQDAPFLDSSSILDLDCVPEHLLILGGGYIALEFGQMFHRFGSRVTVVEKSEQLLEREDPDIAQALTEILREDGLEILTGHEAKSVRCVEGGLELRAQGPDGDVILRGSHLLIAVGRAPNVEALSLEKAGVSTDDDGYIRVDERLQTNVRGIYAMGDVKGGPAFTHIAADDGRVLCANLVHGRDATVANRFVPYAVFTDPQLGRVGLSETQAREQGLEVRIARLPMTQTARGVETQEARGVWKAIVGPDDQILGGAFVSIEAGEIIACLQIAMMGRLPYTALRDATLSHPTLAESLNNLFATLDG